jgi:Mor family transcriptional regulator
MIGGVVMQPHTSFKILGVLNSPSPISVLEIAQKTGLRKRRIYPALSAMLKEERATKTICGKWKISPGGIQYLEEWNKQFEIREKIVQEYLLGQTMKGLANKYSMSFKSVWRLLLRRCPKVVYSRRKKDPLACTTILTSKQEKEIVQLYRSGMGSERIGKQLRISGETVLKIIRHYIPSEIRSPGDSSTKIKPQPPELTPQKAFLIGHLIGDGYVPRTPHGKIVYTNTCLKLVLKMLKVFDKVYGIKGHLSRRGPVFYVKWTSKKAWEDLRKYTLSYHSKEWRIPKEIFDPVILGRPFLRALFDDEGSVTLCLTGRKRLAREISLASACKKGREDIIRLSSLLGIHARNNKAKVTIRGKINTKNFQSRICFSKGVKVRNGHWRGLDKREVLDLLIKSYNNPSVIHSKNQ